VAAAPWWRRIDGAQWNAPFGPGSSIDDILDHPVVHVSWNDARVFAEWAGGRLPNEAEWVHAARGGLESPRFPWGEDEPEDGGPYPCNIWQGTFPNLNTLADGFLGTAPVGSFAPNGYGLYNMAGNVWEWCEDRFRVRSLKKAGKAHDEQLRRNPMQLTKGGSYLCHRSYCYRYRIDARSGSTADSSTGHMGFRIVWPESAAAA
jgi:formylglycine-generating enzyme required for sulfatase activity